MAKHDLGVRESFAPGFLIASPRLDGSPFERAVIVMVHHDEDGAMGFIVNKPLSIDLGSLLQTADEVLTGQIMDSCFDLNVRFGGPVRVEQLWLIYQENERHTLLERDFDELEERGLLHFDERWCLVADSDSIEDFVYGKRHDSYRPYIGYTGWGPGQLEGEIDEGSWLLLDFHEEMVFDENEPEECWQQALERLGVNPMAFLMMAKGESA